MTLSDDIFHAAESILYDNACGRLTARQTKRELHSLGLTADLRMWFANAIDVFDRDGRAYTISI